MEEHTKKKIAITRQNTCPELLELFEPDQLEVKYGGTAPNHEEPLWPPRIYSPNCAPNSQNLISMSEYNEFLERNPKLKRMPDELASKNM